MKIAFIGDSLTSGIPGSSYFAILRERLPGHTLANLGRGNDTVVSLHRRIARQRLGNAQFDLAFLWVGVNDAGGEGSWLFRAANALRRQPRAKNLDQFRTYYQRVLDLLCRHARRVIAVAPLLKGEEIDNEWNRQIDVLARVIRDLAAHYERVGYLDLRPTFYQKLAGKQASSHLLESPLRIGWDILVLRNDAQVDAKAAQRGLHLTLDGVHLNSAGAALVAEAFLEVIARKQSGR
ncbi:MAG: SGNH/GDSL hydrolase family protein [Anaerolineae bacterium]|nr:SGNH/GDSL hydrolase family protein [Anaerolineae bacterium]